MKPIRYVSKKNYRKRIKKIIGKKTNKVRKSKKNLKKLNNNNGNLNMNIFKNSRKLFGAVSERM
jgi:hypothetical protein